MEKLIGKNIKRLKEPVKLRSKKLADGSESLYLDIYYEGKRSYEFLKMYLLPENSSIVKQQNIATLASAEALKRKRIIDLHERRSGIRKKTKGILLEEVVRKFEEAHPDKDCKTESLKSLISRYDNYARLKIDHINKEWIKGFETWLKREYKKSNGQTLAPSTVFFYLSKLSAILNFAERQEIISVNPLKNLIFSTGRIESKPREFLTPDELKKLIKVDCRHETVKRAYLFSCYSGLRVSDIIRLKKENIVTNNGKKLLLLTMKKTGKPISIPLSANALKWLPKKTGKGLIFEGLPSLPTINSTLRKWSKNAGIDKKITFHTSRHTFGTLMITAGADLYTTCRLMGHSDVRTTQIYAKIVDSKKIEAVDMLDRMFGR